MRLVAIAVVAACGTPPRPAPIAIAPAAAPPASVCADATTLRTYDAVDGRVTFTDQICSAGCVANACSVARPCSPQPVVVTDVGSVVAPLIVPERDEVYVAGHRRVIRWNTRSGLVDVISETGGRALAVDASSVYWVTGISGTAIVRAPRRGGPSSAVVDGREQILSLAVDDQHVYWSELDVNDTSHNGIWRIAKRGGAIEAFAPNQRGATGVVLDATHVYWTDQFEDRVMRKPKSGGPIETLAAAQDGASWIALDDQFVYWVTRDQIGRVDKAGGVIELFQASGPTGLAVAGGEVLWTSGSDVWHRTAAGVTGPLVRGASHAFGLVVGAKHLYWVTTYPERVMRVRPDCEPSQ